jgi:hypothetical protein
LLIEVTRMSRNVSEVTPCIGGALQC